MRVLAIGCIALVLSGCSAITGGYYAPAKTTLSADRVDLPTVKAGNFLMIDARIDGAGPYRLLVDTGSTGLMLAADVAASAGLKPLPHGVALDVPGARLGAGVARVDRFESGGFRVEGINAALVGTSDLAILRRQFPGFDGIVGMLPLKDVIVEFDIPAGQVSVLKRGSVRFPSKSAVSYTSVSPVVTLVVNGAPLTAVIDTGSAFSLIVPNFGTYPLLYPETKDAGFRLGSSKAEPTVTGILAGTASLGPVNWRNPQLRKQTHGTMGNVGTLALRDWKFAFDQRAHRVYFLETQQAGSAREPAVTKAAQ